MPQLTLVAHYGSKDRPQQAAFMAYVRACQQVVSRSALGECFTPYQEAQIHGTLIGLEQALDPRLAHPAVHYNANLWRRTGELRAMDLDCALALARSLPPLTLRFGGFSPQDDVIESRGQSAYARSFGIHWQTGKVVLIGWRHEDGAFYGYTKLWSIRRNFANRCHVHHKYEDDSDFFVTIGELTRPDGLEESAMMELRGAGEKVVETVRAMLADPLRAVDLPLRAEDLSVVRYIAESLDPASSRAFRVTDPNLNAAVLWRALYG